MGTEVRKAKVLRDNVKRLWLSMIEKHLSARLVSREYTILGWVLVIAPIP